jgi:hypothetical protein
MPTGSRCLPEAFDKFAVICPQPWVLSPFDNGGRDAAAAGGLLAAADTVRAAMMRPQMRATAPESGV